MHPTIIPADSDVLSHFLLQVCNGCDAGCSGRNSNIHCPLCPTSKFKPNRKAKVEQHLLSHFQGKAGNANVSGFIVTACCNTCDAGRKESRSHYHCPFCSKSFTKKAFFLTHADRCAASAADPASVSPAPEVDCTPEGDWSAVGPSSECDPCTEGVSLSADANTAGTPSQTIPADKDTRPCPLCGTKYHRKYIPDHIRRAHSGAPDPGIDANRHHFAAVIDPGRGIYAVARTLRAVPHPIHVVNKTTGLNGKVACEVQDCIDIADAEMRSGLPSYRCDHLKSTEFAVYPEQTALSSDSLQNMVASGFMASTRQQQCQQLQEESLKARAPLVVEVPERPQSSKRYRFFSVFSGQTRWWSKFQRTIVTIDTNTSSMFCRCKRKSCEHRAIVRWLLYQNGQTDSDASDAVGDLAPEVGDPEEADPESGAASQNTSPDEDSVIPDAPNRDQAFSRQVQYVHSRKTIPACALEMREYSREKLPDKLQPAETHCFYCEVPLSPPFLVTRHARVINIDTGPTTNIEMYNRSCPSCGMTYRYQEHDLEIFNYNNRLLLSFPVLLHIRASLVNHTAIARAVSILEYRLDLKLQTDDVSNAYLAFEALVDHGYNYSCVRCGHHPKVLIHDLTKKAVFRFPVNEVQPPQDPSPRVDADQFWCDVEKEILARGMIRRGETNPFKLSPSYHRWAPYIGPQTRNDRLLYNTEYMKLRNVDTQDHNPIPEEIIVHLLADEKVDTVRRFCRLLGISAVGTKLDMLERMRQQSLSKAKFDHAYSALYDHSGGWLSSTCPHNVTYAVKFLLRSESPRDYVDILRSMRHIPTVNIADIANTIANLGNKLVPGLFSPNEGRIAPATDNNIKAAQDGTLIADFPFLTTQSTTYPSQCPPTDWDRSPLYAV